ncbi:MAG: hypothetical protein C4521_05765 [Actinobacteria bacterium]|nr:MAG: hypothetical protein C4521_05765 [Actinomycetota bacterium]
MSNPSLSGVQLFLLVYFFSLSLSLAVAYLYRRWQEGDMLRRFEDLMRHRASLHGMLKILSREAQEISSCSDEDLDHWLRRGPAYTPEGQTLSDVDREMEILHGELLRLRAPKHLDSSRMHLVETVERAREWISRVLSSRTPAQIRSALSMRADEKTLADLARANERIRQFALRHGINEQDSFYHDSYFYV